MSALADGRAPTILTRHGARAKTDRCRKILDQGSALLVELFHGRAHEALGFESWPAYTAAEFGDLRGIRIEVPDRVQLVVGLTRPLAEGGQGMSRRRVADHLGVSVGTVQHDLEVAGVVDLAERRARRATDTPPAAEPPPATSKRDRAVQLAGEQGARGLTALELAEVTGWTGGSATGTMSDLDRQRRLTRTRQYRRGYAAYVVPITPATT
jgi:hypothetical protein